MSTTIPAGVVIGLLCNPDGIPCTETDSSPSIRVGQRTTLSSQGDNKSEGWDVLDIASVHEVSVERSFHCLKKDFPVVSAWLAGLNGNTYNAGIYGEGSISGVFSQDGEIEMSSHSPSVGLVRARWTGYVLDVNHRLPRGVTLEKESDTVWLMKMNGVEVLRLTSSDPGDGSGLLLRGGEPVAWRDLPANVRLQVRRAYTNFPTSAAGCTDGRQYYEAVYRPIILTVNGEEAMRWWILVYADGYSTKVLRCRKVYYGTNSARSIKTSTKSAATQQGTVESVTVEFYVPSANKRPTWSAGFGGNRAEIFQTLTLLGNTTLAAAIVGGYGAPTWGAVASSPANANKITDVSDTKKQVEAYAVTYKVDKIGPSDFLKGSPSGRLFYSDGSVNTMSMEAAFQDTETAWTDTVTSATIRAQTVYSVAYAIREAMLAAIGNDHPNFAEGWEDACFHWSAITGNSGVSKNFIPLPPDGICEARYIDPQAIAAGRFTATEVWKTSRDKSERTFSFRDFFPDSVDIYDPVADEEVPVNLDGYFSSAMQTQYGITGVTPDSLEFTLAGGKYAGMAWRYYSHVGYVFFEDTMSGDTVRTVQNEIQLYWQTTADGKVMLRADHKLAGPDVLLTLSPQQQES